MLFIVGIGVGAAIKGESFSTKQGEESFIKREYTIGQEIILEEEEFYVIGEDSKKVILLAKYNLKEDGTQDTTGANNPCAMSKLDNLQLREEENLNDNKKLQEDKNSAIYKAIKYGEKFETEGVIGRLMTLKEIEELGADRNSTTGNWNTNGNDFITSTNYWLASAKNSRSVWYVSSTELNTDYYDYSLDFGVRPVIGPIRMSVQKKRFKKLKRNTLLKERLTVHFLNLSLHFSVANSLAKKKPKN